MAWSRVREAAIDKAQIHLEAARHKLLPIIKSGGRSRNTRGWSQSLKGSFLNSHTEKGG
jgi:hypothetical protein